MSFTFPTPESSHELYKNNLGLVTEDSLNIYSGLIGSSILSDKIMNSPEWFYTGKISGSESEMINAIKQELLKNNPNLSQRELDRTAREILRENISLSGQERIAYRLMQYAPFLSKTEAMKAAEQNYASMLAKKVPDLLDKAADKIKDLLGSPDGRNYLFRMDSRNLAETLRKNPNAKIILPDDQYDKFINNAKFDESARTRVVSEGSITGNHDSLALQQEKLSAMTENIHEIINQAEQQRNYSLRQKIFSNMKKAAPYTFFGAGKALSENWEVIMNAYDNKESWSKALSLTGTDFAGYTVTPMLIDGAFAYAGGKTALFMSMKNAGLGYTLGVLAWEAGRESLAYMLGEIPQDEYYSKLRLSTGRAIETIPANIIAYIVSAGSSTLVVPLIIIAGSYVIPRAQVWYDKKLKEKQWLNTVYPDDVKAILGDELINTFTIIQPERHSSLAEPERRSSLAEPERHSSLARP